MTTTSNPTGHDTTTDAIRQAVVDALTDVAWACSRDWSAWQHGTMGQDDFAPAWEDDDLITSLTDALTPTQPTGRHDDHAQEDERPWFVQVESTLINGEDDVMSPEPGEVVWASSADEASDRIKPRDYDTNLTLVRPASQTEVLSAALPALRKSWEAPLRELLADQAGIHEADCKSNRRDESDRLLGPDSCDCWQADLRALLTSEPTS